MRNNGTENGIAQKFKAFVVFICALAHGPMAECRAVKQQVIGLKAEDIVELFFKILFERLVNEDAPDVFERFPD